MWRIRIAFGLCCFLVLVSCCNDVSLHVELRAWVFRRLQSGSPASRYKTLISVVVVLGSIYLRSDLVSVVPSVMSYCTVELYCMIVGHARTAPSHGSHPYCLCTASWITLLYCRNDRGVVEQYLGKKLAPFKALPKWEFNDYMGWGEQGDGKLWYGLYVQVRAC